jgi:hypothetical protein
VNLRHGAEERHRFVHGHVEHVGDVHAHVIDLERLAVVATARRRKLRQERAETGWVFMGDALG